MKISKLILLSVAVATVICGATGFASEGEKERPNIVLIYADDQGTLDAGCYGASDLSTPNIDRLAKRGLKFTQAYAHTVCCPSRMAVLTGRQPQRGGVNTWTTCNPNDSEGRKMNLNEITLAEHLKEYGYTSALIGKWHLGANPGFGPLEQGFDYFFGFRGGFIDYYTHRFLHAGWQRPQFHDLYRNNTEVFEDGKYFPDMQVEEAVGFLEKNQDKPFFLYLAMNLPHYPEQPDAAFVEQYKKLGWPRSSYAPMISTVDDRIGVVLNKLEELKLSENTLVIYMSDNGHSTEDYYNWGDSYGGNGGGGFTGKWRGAKGSFLEGGLRVPCIISYPKLFGQNQVRNQAVSNLDFFPTICDLLDVPLPANRLDGKTILPILKDAQAESHHEVMHWMWQHMWAVKKGPWKLIYKGHDTTGSHSSHPQLEFEMPELWLANIEDEKPEEINHADEQPALVKELLTLHEEWAEDVFSGSGYPDPNKAAGEEKGVGKGSTKL